MSGEIDRTSDGVARGRKVLVVDDSASQRRHLVQILERAGADTEEACDGADAWRRLRGVTVDLVLTDIHMPVMDGLKLVSLLRHTPNPHQRTPIVVITGLGTDEDRDRALQLGVDAYLEKPVESGELTELAERLLAG